MTRTVRWREIVIAACTLAAVALLLFTIGAPHEHGG
jgi:hypothetical protein